MPSMAKSTLAQPQGQRDITRSAVQLLDESSCLWLAVFEHPTCKAPLTVSQRAVVWDWSVFCRHLCRP